MDNLNLNELLRHAYSGTIFVAALVLLRSNATGTKLAADNLAAAATLGVALVVVVGTLVYVLHRAIIYPGIYCMALKLMWWDRSKRPVDVDLDRFARIGDEKSVQKHLNEWGSQVHLLYCSTWSTLLAYLVACLWSSIWDTAWEMHSKAKFVIGAFAIITLVAAFIHHLRLLQYDRAIAERESPPRKSPPSEAEDAS